MIESLVCKSCNKRVTMGDLKADKSGSGWICLNCYKGQHPDIYKSQKLSQISQIATSKQKQEQAPMQQKPQKVKFYCTDCGYKFYKETIKGQKYTGKCPYCSTYSIREEKDANTILNDTIKESVFRFNPRTDILDD